MQDQQEVHKKIVSQYRMQPGPGEYNHSHYSDFFSSQNDTKQNFFGTEKAMNYPNHLKAPGIGDSVGENVGPQTYRPEGFLTDIQRKQKMEIFTKTAVNQWHKRMFDEERKRSPSKHPEFAALNKKPSPGPGAYIKQDIKLKTFQKPNSTAFMSDEIKKVTTIDRVQMPHIDNPGPGDYIHERKKRPKQENTSNMMSQTSRLFNGQRLHNVNYPSATHYDTASFNTIENPMVTGGAPNNGPLALQKFEMAQTQKALNPFQTSDLSHEKTVQEQTAHLGPGAYNHEHCHSIGQSEFEKSRTKMFSTATKASFNAILESSGSALLGDQ